MNSSAHSGVLLGRATVPALLLTLLWHASGIVHAQQARQLPPARATIRVSADRVDVNVTVTDSRGRTIDGLQRKDFRVFDDGIERPIVSFDSNKDPAQIVFLIESGTADYLFGKLGRSLLVRAGALMSGLSASDRVAVMIYSDRAYVLQDFTSNHSDAELALRNLYLQSQRVAVGSNSLALSSSLAAVLQLLKTVQGKKAIVLFSTGIDTSPPEYRQYVQEELKSSDIPILAVSVFGDFRELPAHQKLTADEREERAFVKQGMSEADLWLRQLASATGGPVYLPKTADDFDRAYARLAQIVRAEYSLGFVPSLMDGKLHTITVKVNHPWYRSYRVEHRQAYLAGTSSVK